MSDKPTLRERYNRGYRFARPVVLRNGSEWVVVGPGWPWLGAGFDTWEAAMGEATAGIGRWRAGR